MKRFMLIFLLLTISIASAQEDCQTLAVEAIETLQTQCQNLEPGEACTLDLQPFLIAETRGEIDGPLMLSIAGKDSSNRVNIAVLGDTTLEIVEEVAEPLYLSLTNPNANDINLRSGPGQNFAIEAVLSQNETLKADGRSTDGEWLRIPQEAQTLWVFANLVEVDGDTQFLPVVDVTTPVSAGSAYILRSTEGCAQAGLLFSYDGDVPYPLTLNDAVFQLVDTVGYARASENGFLELFVLDGQVNINTDEATEVVQEGEAIQVPMEEFTISGKPERLQNDLITADLQLPFELVTLKPIFCVGDECNEALDSAPVQAVYDYLDARVNSDSKAMQALSCAAWDSQALIQAQSFKAMSAELKDVTCETASESDGAAVVSCDGVIVTTYNGATREWPLSGFELVQENDIWQICGEAD